MSRRKKNLFSSTIVEGKCQFANRVNTPDVKEVVAIASDSAANDWRSAIAKRDRATEGHAYYHCHDHSEENSGLSPSRFDPVWA